MKKTLLECPVCHTQLTQDEYYKALGLWNTKQEHIHRLESERKQIEEERKKQAAKTQRLEKEYQLKLATERRKIHQSLLEQKAKFKAQIERSRADWEKANQKIGDARIKQGVSAGIAHEKQALKSREDALRKEQNKSERVQKQLGDAIKKNEESRLQIERLREQLARKSTPQIDGLLEEGALLKSLKEIFPNDRFESTRKDGDIVQYVLEQGKEIGKIIYECKRVKTWSNNHVEQTRKARRQRKADYAVLVTNVFPSKKQHYFVEKTVFVISPISIEPLVILLRESLAQMASLRLSYDGKANSVKLVYDYLSGNEYANKIRDITGRLAEAQRGLQSEEEAHRRTWQKREDSYRHLISDVLSIDDTLRKLIQGRKANRGEQRAAERKNGLNRIYQA